MRLLFYNMYFVVGVMFYSICDGKVSKYKDKGKKEDKGKSIEVYRGKNLTIAESYVVPRAKIQLLYPRGFCITVPGRQKGQQQLRKIECTVNINKPFRMSIHGVTRGQFYFRERSHPRRGLYRFYTTKYEFEEGHHFYVLLTFAMADYLLPPKFFYEEAVVMYRRGYLECCPLYLEQTTRVSIVEILRVRADAKPYNVSWGIDKKSKPRPKKVKRKKRIPVKAAKRLKDKNVGRVG